MYDGRDQRRTGVRVVRVEQIHPLWACKPAHEEGESDPRAWVEEQKSRYEHRSCGSMHSEELTPAHYSSVFVGVRAQTPCKLWLSSRAQERRDLLSRGPPRANTTSDKLSPTSRKQVADRVAEGHRGLDATSAAA
jgi:hypothetical protein